MLLSIIIAIAVIVILRYMKLSWPVTLAITFIMLFATKN